MPKPRRCLTTRSFREAFAKLAPREQEAARKAAEIFRKDPFAPQLRTHPIKRLSARLGRPVYAVEILGDLRAVFYIDRDTIYSFDIGTHDIYK